MNGVNLFTCYDIKAVSLSKYLTLTNISSGFFNNTLNIMVFRFLHTKFATDLTWSLSWNSDSFSNIFNSFLFTLTVWVKIGSIPFSSHNVFKYPRIWCRGKAAWYIKMRILNDWLTFSITSLIKYLFICLFIYYLLIKLIYVCLPCYYLCH